MVENKNKSIAETFNVKLKTPWVWLVIVITIGLTILFYFSQKPQIVVYTQYIKSLGEYQLMEASLMRAMDRVRMGYGADTVLVQSQSMTLREVAVSFSREMDELRAIGVVAPPNFATDRFEKFVLSKVSGMRRYASARMAWHEKWLAVVKGVSALPSETLAPAYAMLDSAKMGYAVARAPQLSMPDTLAASVDSLLAENYDLAVAWGKFDNENALMSSVELTQFFQMERMNEIALKSKIPMVFYFLSLVLLLSTFFFLFRSRQ